MKEFTKNGIEYKYSIGSMHGAHFVLYPEDHHTTEDIRHAKREIRAERDVTGLKISGEPERFHYFKDEVFRDQRTKPLHWSQIQCDFEDWKAEGKPTADEFISKHLEEWKQTPITNPNF